LSLGLLDTSVLIAASAQGDSLPDDVAISVVTIGELQAGIDLARSAEEKQARATRLRMVTEIFDPIPVSEPIALEYGHLLALARRTGRVQKATDLLIAATAGSTGRTLWTRDRSQASLAEEAKIPVSLV
jgi:predicted nucleic acid-binding protein